MAASKPFVWPVRVYLEDTDAGAVVYHASYLRFFERARTELLRSLGVDQMRLKVEEQRIFVVRDIHVDFVMAAKLDDELMVSAGFIWEKGARLGMQQEMVRHDDGQIIATAELSVVTLNSDNHKPARIPAWIKSEIQKNAD